MTYILERSVQRTATQLRVNANLIDARSDSQVWAEAYDQEAADSFKTQTQIAESIVDQLQAKLSPQEKASIEERPTRDMVAFNLYREANSIIDTYTDAQDPGAALLSALQLLDEAIKRDPNSALAFVTQLAPMNCSIFLISILHLRAICLRKRPWKQRCACVPIWLKHILPRPITTFVVIATMKELSRNSPCPDPVAKQRLVLHSCGLHRAPAGTLG